MKKKTKRKVWGLIDTVSLAIAGASITSIHHLDRLRLRELSAIDAFSKGCATVADWSDINAILSIAETMARAGIGRDEVMPACEAAQEYLIDSARRYEKTTTMDTTSLGVNSFQNLYQYHDLQRQSVSRGEYDKTINRARNRLNSLSPGVVEI